MDRHNKNIPFHKVFTQYSKDNSFLLSGVGLIATITALFLNLDPHIYGDTLKDLQILLLLFLTLGLIFLVVATQTWIISNADSWFGGLVTFSIGLLILRLWFFILENFRDELNNYLIVVQISITIIVFAFLYRTRDRVEQYAQISDPSLKSLFYGFISYVLLYLYSLFNSIYQIFYKNKEFNLTIFRKPFYNFFFFQIALWITIIEFCMNNPYIRKKRWFVVFIFSPILVFIIYVAVEFLFVFKWFSIIFNN